MSSLISICIPTYNGALWLKETLRSALAQTYDPLEILIVDDASTDHTLDVIRSFRDPRIRVEVNERTQGLVLNWNHCVRLSKGSLVKFLFQDDVLFPTCVEKMARLFERHERIGMVFSPWDILLENPDDSGAIAWIKRFGAPHTHFKFLREVNRGIDLFNEWLTNGFGENWVGGPSSVMLRKPCLERIGLFNTRMRQASDLEMWMRMMYFYDVGFIEERLSALRFHSASATSHNVRQNIHWLDMMWLLEGLLCYEEIRKTHPQLNRLRYAEAARVVMQQASRIRRRSAMPASYLLSSLIDYMGYSIAALVDRAPPIHQ